MGTKTVNEFTNAGIPVPASDALTDVLREGARRMLKEAVEAEVQEFLDRHARVNVIEQNRERTWPRCKSCHGPG